MLASSWGIISLILSIPLLLAVLHVGLKSRGLPHLLDTSIGVIVVQIMFRQLVMVYGCSF